MGAFKEPQGGELKDLYLDEATAEAARQRSRGWKSWDLSERQLGDLKLLPNGAFSPLEGFLGRADYENVLAPMVPSSVDR
jgi:sulfate adenylyltransferase